jgi:hypothetical protein
LEVVLASEDPSGPSILGQGQHFLQAPIIMGQEKFNLSKCGMFLKYQQYIRAWFGSHMHFEKDFKTDKVLGEIWDPSNA